MASMKDIKLRIKSVESTMQITKAMQLVASSKLRRAREGMEQSRAFLSMATETLERVAAGMPAKGIWYEPKTKKKLYITVAGDRGLAGGYNNNIFKLLAQDAEDAEYAVLPIGKKALEKYDRVPGCVISRDFGLVEGLSVGEAFRMANAALEKYLSGEVGEVILVYTEFKSMLTQSAVTRRLLPLKPIEGKNDHQVLLEQEPDEIIAAVMPSVLAGSIYSAVKASFASEQAARRTAMDSATKNAGEMIDSLSLSYNRARQGAITQEITEIVAGAEQ